MSNNLDDLSIKGHEIFSFKSNPSEANIHLKSWIAAVREYLTNNHPNSGLVAEWLSLGTNELSLDTTNYAYSTNWTIFQMSVDSRLRWLSNLSSRSSRTVIQKYLDTKVNTSLNERKSVLVFSNHVKSSFISLERIKELEELKSNKFELTKLISLCNELNICHKEKCWYSVIALTRTIANYVPPIFGQPNFESVVSQSSTSLKKLLDKLQTDAKNIADHHLHEQAKLGEAILTEQQVDFRNQLDVLLGEVVKAIKRLE